jgi:gas vesicle protein
MAQRNRDTEKFQPNRDTGAGFATGVVTGAMLGVGLALLFAPKAGSLLREDIGESVGSLRDALARRAREVADRAGVELDNLQERAEKAVAAVETSARDMVDATAGDVSATRPRW